MFWSDSCDGLFQYWLRHSQALIKNITQENAGVKDREAVGGEVRYFDTKKSFFTLLDYDVLFNDVNIFLLIGRWTVVDGTTMNIVVDYRNSPILTTTNAIQGQGVETLDALFDRFNEDELRQLAIDHTAKSKAITIGITHQLAQDLQIIAEVTATEFGKTVASAGVEGNPSTGTDLFYSTQLIANKLKYHRQSRGLIIWRPKRAKVSAKGALNAKL